MFREQLEARRKLATSQMHLQDLFLSPHGVVGCWPREAPPNGTYNNKTQALWATKYCAHSAIPFPVYQGAALIHPRFHPRLLFSIRMQDRSTPQGGRLHCLALPECLFRFETCRPHAYCR